jgi:predicted  nucleic acid-binding Zn-ribbon protein
MNKVELNKEIEKLKASLEAHESQVKDLQHDLKTANQRLADADKHKLPESYFGKIEDAISTAVESFDFNNIDSYSAEFEMDYDNTVNLNNIEFDGQDELAEDIQRNIEDLFGVTDDEDEDNESSDE